MYFLLNSLVLIKRTFLIHLSLVDSFFEIFPQLLTFVLVIVGTSSGKRMLRGSSNVVGLSIVVELVLLKNLVDVQLCKLEGTLIHALLLGIVYLCSVWYMVKLFFNKLRRERS
jgi:hypothetical protein